MNKILLVHPKLPKDSTYINPLGIQTLKSYIESKLDYLSVDIFDFNISNSSFDDFIFNIRIADMVGFTTPIGTINHITKIFRDRRFINQINGKPVVLGGNSVSSLNASLLFAKFGCNINWLYFVVGEGEEALLNLVEYMKGNRSLHEIPNLIYKDKNNTVIQNQYNNCSIKNFFEPPSISNDILDYIMKEGSILFLEGLSRGCDYNCKFCFLNTRNFSNKKKEKVRYFPIERCVATLSSICSGKYKSICIQFTDDNFFGGKTKKNILTNAKRLLSFSKTIAKCGISFGIDTRADSLYCPDDDQELIEFRSKVWNSLKNSGLRYIYVGVESFSNSQLKRYKKNINRTTIKKAIEYLNKLRISYTLGLIIFDPLMTLEDLIDNIQFIEQNCLIGKISSLSKELRVQYGTPYYYLLRRNGLNLSQYEKNSIFFKYSHEDYFDNRMRHIVKWVRIFYQLFNGNNYRFSDIQVFMHTFKSLKIINEKIYYKIIKIPEQITKLEFELLKSFSYEASKNTLNKKLIISLFKNNCERDVGGIIKTLQCAKDIAGMPEHNKGLTRNLIKIFNNIYNSIEALIYDE